MNIKKLTFVALLSAVCLTVGTSAPGYAAQTSPPPTKAPTGADCQRIATAAAEKVKNNVEPRNSSKPLIHKPR